MMKWEVTGRIHVWCQSSLSCEMKNTEWGLFSTLVSLELCPSLLDVFRVLQLTEHSSSAVSPCTSRSGQECHSNSWEQFSSCTFVTVKELPVCGLMLYVCMFFNLKWSSSDPRSVTADFSGPQSATHTHLCTEQSCAFLQRKSRNPCKSRNPSSIFARI